MNNPPHQVQIHNPSTGQDEHHGVFVDHRPVQVVDRDPHRRIIERNNGYRPHRDWSLFHTANWLVNCGVSPIGSGWEP